MTTEFSIQEHLIHIWQVHLPDFYRNESEHLALLNQEEIERANRFHFPEHRIRFLTARAMLRKILGLYLQKAPTDIVFGYSTRGKPHLESNPLNLQFNVSHSFEMAVYGITKTYPIGIDIEKIEDKDQLELAKRFFSPKEYAELKQIPVSEQKKAFYSLWSCKEAVIKTSGEGLHFPLESFSVAINQPSQTISLNYEGKTASIRLEKFSVPQDYQAAFATEQEVSKVCLWQWSQKGIINL